MSAPTSRTILKPTFDLEGQSTAIAGRLIPSILRRRIIDMAISAPVFPHETQASAWPFFTYSNADHIDEFFPLRTTWLGLSLMFIISVELTIFTQFLSLRRLFTKRFNNSSGPCNMKYRFGLFAAERAIPAITAGGPKSPPIASILKTMRLLLSIWFSGVSCVISR